MLEQSVEMSNVYSPCVALRDSPSGPVTQDM
jgi:hypothetical protein